MKAIICAAKGIVHLNSFSTEWTPCACGNVRVKWLNPVAGTVVVAAKDQRTVRLLGLNNNYLIPTIESDKLSWADHKGLHELSTKAPNHIFDKSRIGCWAVVVPIASTSDVRWATKDEHDEAFAENK